MDILHISKCIKAFKPDYYISNTNKGALYLSILRMIYRIPVENIMVFLRDFQWKYRRIIFSLLKNATIAVPNIATLEYGENFRLDTDDYRIFVTGNPAQIMEEKCCYSSVHSQVPYAALLANVTKWKGIIYAIKAYHKSKLYLEGMNLQIYGKIVDDNYYHECIEYIHKHGLDDYVRFAGFCDDTASVYKNSLMVLNTSLSSYGGPETFGRTIIEAWSHRKPVIVFSTGAPKYIVDDGVDGFQIPEGDVEALADKMQQLFRDNDLAERMGEVGYQKVQREYDSKIVAKRIMDYIERK